MTSKELPASHRKKLEEVLSDIPWAELVLIDADQTVGEETSPRIKEFLAARSKGPTVFASCRLDDDDGLSKDYLHRLSPYITEENIGRGISFGLGFGGRYSAKTEKISNARWVYYPKIAIGLAYIGLYNPKNDSSLTHIYGGLPRNPNVDGNKIKISGHTKIDIHFPTILDSRHPAYFYTIHAWNDSGPKPVVPKQFGKEDADLDELVSFFPFLQEHLTETESSEQQ